MERQRQDADDDDAVAVCVTFMQVANKKARQVVFKRAEQYVNEYRKKEREEIRLRRVAKSSGEFYVPAQPKVYFVIRLRG